MEEINISEYMVVPENSEITDNYYKESNAPDDGNFIKILSTFADDSKLPPIDNQHKWEKFKSSNLLIKYEDKIPKPVLPKGKIEPKEYTGEEFYNAITKYIPVGMYRKCKGNFTISSNSESCSKVDGYIVVSNLYLSGIYVIFCDSPRYRINNNEGVKDGVYLTKFIETIYADDVRSPETTYPITIGGNGITFE